MTYVKRGSFLRRLTAIPVLILVTACATPHSIRPIVYKVPGFDEARYQQDLADCRQQIESQAPPGASADTIAGQTAVGTGLGAIMGALIGLPFGRPLSGAVIGGAAGGGTAAGGAYAVTELDKRRTYASALTQCLTLKGYKVLDTTIAQ